MQEQVALQEMIAETVSAYCAQTGGGIPLGFIYAIQHIDSAGESNVHIGCMDNQSPLTSAGLSSYIQRVVDFEVEDDIFGCDCEDDD